MNSRRVDYINLALMLGMSIVEIYRDLTPRELDDLIKEREEAHERWKNEHGKK